MNMDMIRTVVADSDGMVSNCPRIENPPSTTDPSRPAYESAHLATASVYDERLDELIERGNQLRSLQAGAPGTSYLLVPNARSCFQSSCFQNA
jgi:hypothetical protein